MGKRTNGGSGKMPAGQQARGFPAAQRPNPKNNASRRPDHVGFVPGEGGATNMGTSKVQTSDAFPGSTVPARFAAGSSADLPDPQKLNRGYTPVEGDVPSTVNVSKNRQRYGIDPGDVTQPPGSSQSGPEVPRYGVGTNGE